MKQPQKNKAELEKATNVHTVYHGLCVHLRRWYFKIYFRHKKDLTPSKKKYRRVDWPQVRGYRAVKRIVKFASKNPEVIDVCCDDHIFSSSNIFLIPHSTKKKFMGVTMLFVPQCAEEQNIMFLYPGHLDNLIKQLTKLQKEQRKLKRK